MSEQDLISADLRTHTDPDLDEKVEALQLCLRSAKAKLEAVEQLPALWKRRMARPWQPCAQPDRFISDLTEALGADDE
jgi:hypothetical protein